MEQEACDCPIGGAVLATLGPDSGGWARTTGWSPARAARAASRCSPTIRTSGLTAPPVWYFAHSAAPGVDVDRRDAARRARRGARAQRAHRLGLHQHRAGRAGPLHREARQRGRLPHARRPARVHVHRGNDQGQGRAPTKSCAVRISRHGPVISDVSRAAQSRGAARLRARASPGPRSRRTTARCRRRSKLARARDWHGFLAAARDFHVAAAEHRSTPTSTATSASSPPAACRCASPTNDLKGLAPAPGWDATLRLGGLRSLRAAAAAAFNPPSGADRERQPEDHAAGLYALHHAPNGSRPTAPNRIAASCSRRRRSTAWRASPACRPTWCRCRCASCCRGCSRPSRAGRGRRARRSIAAAMGRHDGGGARRAADRLGLVARAHARALRRRAGRRVPRSTGGRARSSCRTCSRGDRGPERWCDDVRTPRSGNLRRSCSRPSLDSGACRPARRAMANDPSTWRWGEAHVARHEHRPFGRQPLARRTASTSACRRRATPTRSTRAGIDFIDEPQPVRQPPRGEPARDLRPRRPGEVRCSSTPAGSRATCSRRTTLRSPRPGRRASTSRW